MDRTLIEPTDRFPKAVSQESIGKLHFDLLALIYQYVVDEDAPNFLAYYPSSTRNRELAVVRLALVNRRWKYIVYETPSLWSIIEVVLFEPIEREQNRLDRLTARAKNSPVDLYLLGVHSHLSGASYSISHPKNCACNGDRLAVNLKGIQNLLSLTATLWNIDAVSLINLESLPSLKNVKQFRHRFTFPYGVKLELEPLLSSMPKLTELYIDKIEMVTLPTSKPPLLPHLRTLDVNFSISSMIGPLLSFLLHCPNLVNLHVELWKETEEAPINILMHPNITFHRLKKLHIPNTDTIRQIFATDLVRVPVLEDLYHGPWHNRTFHEWLGFFASGITLKRLTIAVHRRSQYDRALRELPNLEELTLRLDCQPTSEMLSLLCLPDATSSGPTHHLAICPNLRRISFQINVALISLHAFETFVHTRCIPIDEECKTIAGYRAIDSIIFQIFYLRAGENVMGKLHECSYAKKAVVRQLSPTDYRVHWPFDLSESDPVSF